MNTTATRARTLLALGILAATSAVLWTLPYWDRISARADDTDTGASIAVSVAAVILAASVIRAKSDREARVRNLSLLMPLVATQVTPRGGDGQDQPQPRPQWYSYLNEPAA